MKTRASVMLLALPLALAACGDKAQPQGTRMSDVAASDGAKNDFVAAGWKPGDAASWEQQMRNRAQGQDEYSRTKAQ